jgi:dTDP-4-dehydrorhamnose 3,5-epimerase-like enzyme
MQIPTLIAGGAHEDDRGILHYNNEFVASDVKRIYTITNKDQDLIRAWQGHKIERRWFSAIGGAFRIKLIQIDNWESPSKDLPQLQFSLSSDSLDVLLVPSGYVTSIQASEENSKLLLMSDYAYGEVKDEYRFDKTYFSEI